MNHTKGPWQVVNFDGLHIETFAPLAKECETICTMSRHVNSKANASLLAAAPDLLLVCEEALEQFKDNDCTCDGGYGDDGSESFTCYFHRIERDLRNVIYKVTGK